MDCGLADAATQGNLFLRESEIVTETEQFFGLPHGQPFLGHEGFLHPQWKNSLLGCPASAPSEPSDIQDLQDRGDNLLFRLHPPPTGMAIHIARIVIHIPSESLFTSTRIRSKPSIQVPLETYYETPQQ